MHSHPCCTNNVDAAIIGRRYNVCAGQLYSCLVRNCNCKVSYFLVKGTYKVETECSMLHICPAKMGNASNLMTLYTIRPLSVLSVGYRFTTVTFVSCFRQLQSRLAERNLTKTTCSEVRAICKCMFKIWVVPFV